MEDYRKLDWKGITDPFLIHRTMFKAGGYLRVGSKEYGEGPWHHFKGMVTALWPKFDWHRWSELLLQTFVENNEVGIMGPGSSGKTYCSAVFALTMFYCWPTGTSIVMSSTTRQGLQLRIWGAIKELNKAAKNRRSWLPGKVVESQCLLVNEGEDEDLKVGNDFRDGIIGVACFLPGTMIDTPHGQIPIERLKVGDEVLNACGVGRVCQTHVSNAKQIVRVHLSDGRSIDCTPEHPFFTDNGWVKAVDLETSAMVFSAHEAMRIVQRKHGGFVSQSETLRRVQDQGFNKAVRGMRGGVSVRASDHEKDGCAGSVLLKSVFRKMGGKAKVGKEDNAQLRSLRKAYSKRASESGVLFDGLKESADADAVQGMRHGVHFNSGIAKQTTFNVLREILQAEINEEEASQNRGNANTGRVDCLEDVPASAMEHAFQKRNTEKERIKKLVQTGHRVSGHKAGCRNRRRGSQNPVGRSEGCSEDSITGTAWVDRVEVLEPRSLERYGTRESGYTVYNLAVTGHPSYSANGVLVHNCKVGGQFVGLSNYVGLKNDRVILIADEASLMERGFLDSVANLRKNPMFKLIAMGNPKDRTDALGTVCEPHPSAGGWDGIGCEEKTRTWKTRVPGGIAVQLCGFDTPNADYPKGVNPYRGIITPEQIAADLEYYGRDSLQFSMMNLGVMPRDGGSRRIITMSLCEQNSAFDEPVWMSSDKLTRVLGLDAAYSGIGGDRCVLIDLTFGPDVKGDMVLAFSEVPIIVPVTTKAAGQAEEQIAKYVQLYAEKVGVPPNRCGFDSTGRGTLMSAFARLWSPAVLPIEFGGKPGDRPVRAGDPKTEKEAYGKNVTALWYASRLVVEGKQMRKLPREVAEEGCMREWGVNRSGLVDVEPKEKTKERMGRSPDLWDALVVAIEVARRNGFSIASGKGVGIVKRRTPEWLTRMHSRHTKTLRGKQLTYR